MRRLVLILGDQLSLANPALDGFDPQQDAIVMIEAASEGMAVWSHKARIVLFLSAMRHFALEIGARGWPFIYLKLDDPLAGDFATRLQLVLAEHQPLALVVAEPGEWRMEQILRDTCTATETPLRILDDTHFLCSRIEFAVWAKAKKELRMEFFYRVMRKKHGVLMDDGQPAGGEWNYDAENRSGFPKRTGPGAIPAPAHCLPDALTREVIALVEAEFSDHPGSTADFIWPVDRAQALVALERFIETRLVGFGAWQDAMWTDTPFGWHALLSTSLNLHLLSPAEVIGAAETAYRDGRVALASAEGFIRQILGWREFIRGVYWLDMPAMKQANHYDHQRPLPAFYWTGQTGMACIKAAVMQTLQFGYAHHIQRLMVTGNFALLAQLAPREVTDWYLAVYVDAVEWVELPNTAGMALHALGKRFTSKPYIASGAYIHRQSNYCQGCKYDPAQRTGPAACPFTTLYWNFLDQHEAELAGNPRTALMAKNVTRLSPDERASIRTLAAQMLSAPDAL
ncbi:cryptochrome/photolyase family protein [Actimicrobium sp. GrIS 1.19]|uniref:cryptochrome/photolyase family protein n=1 Tax=Actimicrobium sp. GrIS 1.19 TaxID=3071708 RepID=UPI002E159718